MADEAGHAVRGDTFEVLALRGDNSVSDQTGQARIFQNGDTACCRYTKL
jgi:hypothetical protein